MEDKKTIALGFLVLAGVGGFLLFGQDDESNQPVQTPQVDTQNSNEQSSQVESDEMQGSAITYTSSGYIPETLTVEAGETVVFMNDSGGPMWPASNLHPVHTDYLDSSITKCGTDEEGDIFDACRGIESGGSYSFQFNEVGTWDYHDHLNPSRGGTIIVE